MIKNQQERNGKENEKEEWVKQVKNQSFEG